MTALLIGVTGTDTGAGKTVVAAGLTRALRSYGLEVDALKLIATGVVAGAAGEDAELLGLASARPARDSVLLTYALPRSPLAAARAEGRDVDVDALARAVRTRAERGADVLIVEGIGGILVPLTADATIGTLFRRLDARMVIAGRAGLGTVNHCALTIEVCRGLGLRLLGVVLSDGDGVDSEFARDNATQVASQSALPVFGVLPRIADPADVDELGTIFSRDVDVDALLREARSAQDRATGIIEADRSHVWHPFTQVTEWAAEEPLVIRSGEGCWLIGEDGRRYLDGIASLWANVHGHAHPSLNRALLEQAGRVAHSTFLGQTHESGALLAAELATVTPPGLGRVFYSEAGASAVEVALRIALLAQQRRGFPRRVRFLSVQDAYHGDTAGAVSVGRSEPFHRGLDPLLFDVLRVPSPYIAGEEEALLQLRSTVYSRGEQIAALLVEPRMQGAAGMLPHSDEWLRAVVGAARQAGILVICDEVATGFGRTCDLFASGGAGIEPDILVLGKGLSGGYLPLSATVVTEPLYDLFGGDYESHRTLYYGHTYSGNPLACAVARASLRLFETESTLARARSLARHLERRLRQTAKLGAVFDVRQKGVMLGIELRREDGAPFEASQRVGRAVALATRSRGAVVRPLGDVIVLNPPLVMSKDEADFLLAAVEEAITDVTAKLRTPRRHMSELSFVDVRGDADIERYVAVEAESFGEPPEDIRAETRAGTDHTLMRMALLGDELVAGYALMPVGQYFGGQSVPGQAVASVFVHPAWRRRGIAGRLLEDLIRAANERGAALAPLYASTTRLYRRFGWEVGERTLWCKVRTDALVRLRGEGQARARPNRGDVEAMRRRFLARFDGAFDRPEWWLSVHWDAGGKEHEQREYGWFEDDRLTGHTTFRQSMSGGEVALQVQDLVAETPDALGGLLGLLGGHEAQVSQITFKRAAALLRELSFLLPDVDKVVSVEGSICWMQRVVDLDLAVRSRGWSRSVDARLELELSDPCNSEPQRVVLEISRGRGSISGGGAGSIRCGVGALSAWYSSRLSAWEAERLALLQGGSDDLALMDAVIDSRPSMEPDYF